MMLQTMITSLQRHNRTLSLYGFTLLELMVVLVIIAAMVAVVVAYATRSNESLKIKQECLSMADAVKYIADLAMDTKRPTRIVINPKTNSYLLEIATGISHQSFRPIEDFGGGIRHLGRSMWVIDTTGFSAEGNKRYLIFEPTRPWPNASISFSTGDSVKTIKIRGKQVEIEDSAI
jgi:prepilin-type N-terminal cleavage/methylation domain-containing protein